MRVIRKTGRAPACADDLFSVLRSAASLSDIEQVFKLLHSASPLSPERLQVYLCPAVGWLLSTGQGEHA